MFVIARHRLTFQKSAISYTKQRGWNGVLAAFSVMVVTAVLLCGYAD